MLEVLPLYLTSLRRSERREAKVDKWLFHLRAKSSPSILLCLLGPGGYRQRSSLLQHPRQGSTTLTIVPSLHHPYHQHTNTTIALHLQPHQNLPPHIIEHTNIIQNVTDKRKKEEPYNKRHHKTKGLNLHLHYLVVRKETCLDINIKNTKNIRKLHLSLSLLLLLFMIFKCLVILFLSFCFLELAFV